MPPYTNIHIEYNLPNQRIALRPLCLCARANPAWVIHYLCIHNTQHYTKTHVYTQHIYTRIRERAEEGKKENHPKTYGYVYISSLLKPLKPHTAGGWALSFRTKIYRTVVVEHAKALRYYNVEHRSLYSSTPFYCVCVCVFVTVAEHQWRQ